MKVVAVGVLTIGAVCAFGPSSSSSGSGARWRSAATTRLGGVVSRKWFGDDAGSSVPGAADAGTEFGDAASEGFETAPDWLEMFPPQDSTTEPEIVRDYPDYPSLAPDDPLFIDMPWPSEAGPEASAFGKHMQWRRALSDGERKRWQQWAVYQRLMQKHHFGYSLEDFIFQHMLRDIYTRADTARTHGHAVEEAMWRALAVKHKDEQETEVRATMKSLYSAFNRKNYDELRTLWLPDEHVELTMPGYSKARGPNDVQKLYRQIVKDARPFGSVDAKVVAVNSNGFVAVVQTVEVVAPGTDLKVLKKKQAAAPPSKPPPPKRVLATTVLRKWNQQWRVVLHHAARFTTSPFTGDQIALTAPKTGRKALASSGAAAAAAAMGLGGLGGMSVGDKAEREEKVLRDMARYGLPEMSSAELDSLLKGGSRTVTTTSRLNKDGAWERVVSVDDKTRDELNRMRRLGGSAFGRGGDRDDDADDDILGGRDKSRSDMRVLTGMIGNSATRDAAPIDVHASVSKQAVQALRYLFKAGRLTRDDKEVLLLDIIDNAVREQTSVVVVAFELLVLQTKRPGRGDRRTQGRTVSSTGLEEFAEQCKVLVSEIRRGVAKFRGAPGFYEMDDDVDDDEEEVGDEEDGEEGEEVDDEGAWVDPPDDEEAWTTKKLGNFF